jgi:hypothetical protein
MGAHMREEEESATNLSDRFRDSGRENPLLLGEADGIRVVSLDGQQRKATE